MDHSRWLALAALALAEMAGAGAAAAQSPTKTAPAPCRDAPGDYLHDGFFARSEPGLAFLRIIVDDSGDPPRRSSVRGLGQSSGLSIGETPFRGLVIGGSIWTARIDPEFIEDGARVTPDDDSVKLTLLRLGPFVDWYPNPRRGFHALASLAFTTQIETDTKGDPLRPAALGAAFTTGLGHDWFLSSEFSVGLLGRLSLGGLFRTPLDGNERMLFAIPELSLAATYH